MPVILSSQEARFSRPFVRSYSLLSLGNAVETCVMVKTGQHGAAAFGPHRFCLHLHHRHEPNHDWDPARFCPLVTFPDEHCDKVFKF